MDLSAFGWRDALLVGVVLVGVYLALLLLRLAQLRRPRKIASAASPPPAADAPVAEPRYPASVSAPAPAAGGFGEQLAQRMAVDSEMQQLRAEVAALRREVQELKAARRVSPQYSDAMALARRGFDARGIAEECGISVGEAELVLAMSRDELSFEDEVDDGGDTRPTESAGR